MAIVAAEVPAVHLLVGDDELLLDLLLAGHVDAGHQLLALLGEGADSEGHQESDGPLAHSQGSFHGTKSRVPHPEVRRIIAPRPAKSKGKSHRESDPGPGGSRSHSLPLWMSFPGGPARGALAIPGRQAKEVSGRRKRRPHRGPGGIPHGSD